MPTSIQAVIIDLGGVILRTEDPKPREHWERRLGLPKGALHDLVFGSEASLQATLGKATAEAVWRSVADGLSLSAEDLEALRNDFWAGDRIDDQLIARLRTLRQGYQTALLSNAWPSTRTALENHWGIADAFDLIVLSAELGLAKPDPRIYQMTLSQLGVPPEQALFIDDMARNIEAAHRLGIQTLHFREPEEAYRRLDALLGGRT